MKKGYLQELRLETPYLDTFSESDFEGVSKVHRCSQEDKEGSSEQRGRVPKKREGS